VSIPIRWALALVGLALLRSLAFGLATPTYQSSDEPWHLDYARALSEGHVPVLGDTALDDRIVEHDRRLSAADGLTLYGIDSVPMSREAFQPPLGYVLPAIAYRFAGGPRIGLILFRTINALLGAVIALLAFRLGRTALPTHTYAAPMAGLAAVALPSVGQITATANNDALAVALSLVVLIDAADVARRGASWPVAVRLGALVGLAAMVRTTSLLLLLPCGLAVLLSLHLSIRVRLLHIAATAGVAIWIVLPWMARNRLVYGDFLGTAAIAQFSPSPGRRIGGWGLLFGAGPAQGDADRFWPEMGRGAVGVLRWADLYLPPWVYGLSAVAAAAGVVAVVRWLRSGANPADRRATVVLIGALVALLAGVVYYSWFVDYQPQGRYLIAALLGLAAVGGAAVNRAGFMAACGVLAIALAAGLTTTVHTFGWG
jgi:4-amino-4-deoxy-L-arabinose transferase-like glycosyltransferase